MKIHLAVDLAALGPALELAESVCDDVDSLWVGPTLLKNERLKAAEAFKTSFCDKPVVVDMRTTGFGGLEAQLAFAARADAITVFGIAAGSEVIAAERIARQTRRELIANLYGAAEPVRRAECLARLGVQGFVVELANRRGGSGISAVDVEAIVAVGIPVYLSGCTGGRLRASCGGIRNHRPAGGNACLRCTGRGSLRKRVPHRGRFPLARGGLLAANLSVAPRGKPCQFSENNGEVTLAGESQAQ